MMPSSTPTLLTKLRFPLIFGFAMITASVAFVNRRYFLQGIEEEAKLYNKQDPESQRLFDQVKLELNSR